MATEKFQQSVSTFLALLPISYHITIMTFLPLGLRGLETSQGNSSCALSCHLKKQTDFCKDRECCSIKNCRLYLATRSTYSIIVPNCRSGEGEMCFPSFTIQFQNCTASLVDHCLKKLNQQLSCCNHSYITQVSEMSFMSFHKLAEIKNFLTSFF